MNQHSPSIRILVVTGHTILSWGLKQLVSTNEPATRLVGDATTTTELQAVIMNVAPDVVLLDLDMADIQAANIAALANCSAAKILVMTRQDDQAQMDKAVLDGARGVLKRQATPANFIEAIHKVHAGQIWLDRTATGRIMVALSRRHNGHVEDKKPSRLSTLTEREKSIVSTILENSGDPARTVAKKLHISESTLRNHLTSIYGKLGISNRFQLISFAHKHDLKQAPLFATG